MITVRKSESRGRTKIDWLDSRHSFSFGSYYNPDQRGFRSLAVINEDFIAPGKGFDTHDHDNMEIITIVLAGALEHKDSLGTGSTITPGEVQKMSAGTGIEHSEFNHSKTKPVHLLQIWIVPDKKNVKPSYAQKRFKNSASFTLVASPNPKDNSIKLEQDALLFKVILDGKEKHDLAKNRGAWIQIISGSVTANGTVLSAGDGAAVENEARIEFSGKGEFLLFDLE